MNLHLPLMRALVQETSEGRPVALCAVVRTAGSTPQAPGALLLLRSDYRTVGTLGGGCVEAEVIRRAYEHLRNGQSAVMNFALNHDYGWDDGLICGGQMDIAVMPIGPSADAAPFRHAVAAMEQGQGADLLITAAGDQGDLTWKLHVEAQPTLVIAGAGHVGAALAKMAVGLEFDVVAVDDRVEFANAERLPPPIKPVVADIEAYLRQYCVDPNTYLVIVTRGHRHDQAALGAVVQSPARYIGMIGSRRKVKLIFDALGEEGVPPECIERVHAPIGLDIRAVTVPEIAVSIAAELIATRRSQKYKPIEGPLGEIADCGLRIAD